MLKVLPEFLSEISVENSGNMVETRYPKNVRTRDFTKFYEVFAELQHFKDCKKV